MNTALILSNFQDSSTCFRYNLMQKSINELLQKLGNPEIKPNDSKVIEYLLRYGSPIAEFDLSSPIFKTLLELEDYSFNDFVYFFGLSSDRTYDSLRMNALGDLYLRRKQDRAIKLKEGIKDITQSTYGLFVYIEQIEELFRRVTQKSIEEARLFIRDFRKGIPEAIDFEQKFYKIGICYGYDKSDLIYYWDQIEDKERYKIEYFYPLTACWLMYQVAYLEFYHKKELDKIIEKAKSAMNLDKDEIISLILSNNK